MFYHKNRKRKIIEPTINFFSRVKSVENNLSVKIKKKNENQAQYFLLYVNLIRTNLMLTSH